MAFPRNPNRKLDAADFILASPKIVMVMMGLGLFSSLILPEWLAKFAIWLFLLPFLLFVAVLAFSALAGVLGRLFR